MFKTLILGIIFSFSAQAQLPVNLVVVHKEARSLELVHLNTRGIETVIKEYPIMLGGNPVGHKVQEGDKRTPEGRYTLDWKNPNSAFHLSIHINYPNQVDRETARRLGVSPGGEIFIHGMPNNIRHWLWLFPNRTDDEARQAIYEWLTGLDWTLGCIAVQNHEMEEIYGLVSVGTPIVIYP